MTLVARFWLNICLTNFFYYKGTKIFTNHQTFASKSDDNFDAEVMLRSTYNTLRLDLQENFAESC